jgi:hypothetical protein
VFFPCSYRFLDTDSCVVLRSGYKQLANDIVTNDAWLTTHFPKCEHSKACLLSLLAFQTAIDVSSDDVFDRYYDQALTQFTKEACSPKPIRPDSLFFAGLFMCTICVSVHSTPTLLK